MKLFIAFVAHKGSYRVDQVPFHGNKVWECDALPQTDGEIRILEKEIEKTRDYTYLRITGIDRLS